MTWLKFFVLVVVFFNVGVLAGMFMAYIATSRNSMDVWEVRNDEGHVYYLYSPEEVVAALQVDGLLAVRRLRVLV